MTEHLLSFKDCESIGGHCWRSTHFVLDSMPPQHPEICKHCGATRRGMEQERLSYTDPHPARGGRVIRRLR